MTPITTEDFPYTKGYVMELLQLDEQELVNYTHLLNINPNRDEKTGKVIFTHRDIELLKKAVDMKKNGHDNATIVSHLGVTRTDDSQYASSPAARNNSIQQVSPSGPNIQAGRAAGNRDNIAVMVEAVSQVKEGILKDLSRLLDDKLAGLDEVVVELIRCKSENDNLRKKLEDVTRSKEQLEYELSRFKPVQFGFYKKN